ncbi:MAG: DUF3429 domain-containing protein [Pseudomonadales bacterium]|nr:DUF3429 domain-containing protein [Pseudomonadales bacterium]
MVVHNKSLAITLGLLGLIPFIVLPSSITFIPDYSYLISMAFSYYSAVILAFLAGTLWHSEAAYLSIASNLLALYAAACLFLFHLAAEISLYLLAAGFVMMLGLDFFRQLPRWYWQLRCGLSITVLLMHCCLLFQI